MPRTTPRIGVLAAGDSGLPDRVRAAGGEPVPLALFPGRPREGVALVREWVADAAEISCASEDLDGLLIAAEEPKVMSGLVLSALRLNLPAVVDPPRDARLLAALAALGLAPLAADPEEVAVEVAGVHEARPLELIEDFSLANALRAACSLGAGPEVIVHLSAIARETAAFGFDRMLRVLVPETPQLSKPGSGWLEAHGVAGLLALLGDTLNDTRSVEGRLHDALPPLPPRPPPSREFRLILVTGRASGTEGLCRAPESLTEIAGECQVYSSEKAAVGAVEGGSVEPGSLLVVTGCGPRGGPGLLRLDRLAKALREKGLDESVAIITDGVSPAEVQGSWISLVSPEAAEKGVIGLLRDGDHLRIDLAEGRIRTSVSAEEIDSRDPYEPPETAVAGYAARYARSALPALEGAGFG